MTAMLLVFTLYDMFTSITALYVIIRFTG